MGLCDYPASEESPQHVEGRRTARAKKGEAGTVGAAGDGPGLADHSTHRHGTAEAGTCWVWLAIWAQRLSYWSLEKARPKATGHNGARLLLPHPRLSGRGGGNDTAFPPQKCRSLCAQAPQN